MAVVGIWATRVLFSDQTGRWWRSIISTTHRIASARSPQRSGTRGPAQFLPDEGSPRTEFKQDETVLLDSYVSYAWRGAPAMQRHNRRSAAETSQDHSIRRA